MNPRQLTRELRRLARQEVPRGEPNLWPEIQRQVSQRRTPYSSPSAPGSYVRSESSSGNPDLSSVYVWSTDARPSRFGGTARLVASGAALALVVVVLAVLIGNRGGGDKNKQPVGAIASPTVSGANNRVGTAVAAFPAPTWSSSGALTVPIRPVNGSNLQANVDAQIMPTNDLRLITSVDNSVDIVTWHVVRQTCNEVSSMHEQELSGQDVIPSFLQYGWYYTFISADKTHQPLTLVVFKQRNGTPVGCVTIPAVPTTFTVAYQPASGVPRTCPVTVPSQPIFTPSGGQPADPSHPLYGDYWYGTNDLWLGLPLDGTLNQNVRLFWWSASFSANAETHPDLVVSAVRLDGYSERQPFVDHPSTADGAMLVGMTFPTSGCWQVTAEYRGHSLSFVVWVKDVSSTNLNPAPGPVPKITPTPGADGLTHTDLACHASSFGPSTENPSDINVEIRGIASVGQFWALLFQQLPLYANEPVQIAWKIDSPLTPTLTMEDTQGNQIEPKSNPVVLDTANWSRPGTEWLNTFTFPHSGCWHAQLQAGSFTGDIWFEVFSRVSVVTPAATPDTAPVATGAPVLTISDCVNAGAADLLNQFVDSFNRDDDASLKAMLPDAPLSDGAWLAAVTTSDGTSTTGDTWLTSRVDFLNYIAQRHLWNEQLQVEQVLAANTTWLPGYVSVVADLYRQANDLPEQHVRVVAMISCDRRQVGAWSVGATVDTPTATNLTGNALIEETLRQRQLRNDVSLLPGGFCPADVAHTVNPALSPAVGSGPLYMVDGQTDSNGALQLHPTSNDAGWTLFKVVWTSDPSYQGPVLVRGSEVAGSNTVGFGGNSPPEPNLYFTAPTGNFTQTGYIRIKDDAPGCYALQVDGLNFSETIVIEVIP